jgi:hypothetical protein
MDGKRRIKGIAVMALCAYLVERFWVSLLVVALSFILACSASDSLSLEGRPDAQVHTRVEGA